MSTRVQGVATSDPSQCEPAPSERAKACDGLHCVLGTRRHEPAVGTKQGADETLVSAQQGDEEFVDHNVITEP